MSDDSLCQKQSGPFLIVVFLLVLFQLRVQSTDTIDGLILLFVCLAHHYFKEYDVFGLKISKRTSPHLKAVTNHNG